MLSDERIEAIKALAGQCPEIGIAQMLLDLLVDRVELRKWRGYTETALRLACRFHAANCCRNVDCSGISDESATCQARVFAVEWGMFLQAEEEKSDGDL